MIRKKLALDTDPGGNRFSEKATPHQASRAAIDPTRNDCALAIRGDRADNTISNGAR